MPNLLPAILKHSRVALGTALKSPFSSTRSRSSAPGMQKAHVHSSPLFFCVTEFPWPGGDRWLVKRLAAARSEGPGLPASPFSVPRDPPQLQVQQQQQQQQ